jgi:hypothetical protein
LQLAAARPARPQESALLVADAEATRELSDRAKALRDGELVLPLQALPNQAPSALRILTLRVGAGPLCVAIEKRALVVAGGGAALGKFAQELALYLEYNDLREEGMHCHVDHNDFDWVAADSVPLIVAACPTDERRRDS